MSKVRIELNSAGIRELLKSPEMEAILAEQVSQIRDSCGDGYATDARQMPTRAIASVYTETAEAYQDTLDNNTLLRGLLS